MPVEGLETTPPATPPLAAPQTTPDLSVCAFSSTGDVVNGADVDVEVSSDLGTREAVRPLSANSDNVLGGQFGARVTFSVSNQAHLRGVSHILGLRTILQVFNSIVQFIPVLVIDLDRFRTRTQKRLGNQLMDASRTWLAVFTQSHAKVATRRVATKKASVCTHSLSRFQRCFATNATRVRHAVQALVTNDRNPSFLLVHNPNFNTGTRA